MHQAAGVQQRGSRSGGPAGCMLGRRTQLPARRGGAPGSGPAAAGPAVGGLVGFVLGRRTRRRACSSGSSSAASRRGAPQAQSCEDSRRARSALPPPLAPAPPPPPPPPGAGGFCARSASTACRAATSESSAESFTGRLSASADWQHCPAMKTCCSLPTAHSLSSSPCAPTAGPPLHTKQDSPCRPQGAAPCPGWTGLRASHGASAPAARSRGPEPGRAPGARRAPRAAPRAARRARPAGRAARRGAPPRATPRGPGLRPARGTQRAGPALGLGLGPAPGRRTARRRSAWGGTLPAAAQARGRPAPPSAPLFTESWWAGQHATQDCADAGMCVLEPRRALRAKAPTWPHATACRRMRRAQTWNVRVGP